MDELKKALAQGMALWKKLPARSHLVLVGALLVTLAGVAFVSLRGTVEAYATLFAGLSPEDAGQVIETLKADKVPFRIGNAGTAIEVPEARVHEVRLTLAQKGMPHGGGVGFELFDKQSFGTTSFVEQMNYQRALQGELARTIMSLEEVEAARVHLAMPEKSLYRAAAEPASASVALKLRPGRQLGTPQVRGIVHLVAASVEGLQPERVTVLDERGNVLSSADDAAGSLDAQQAYERSLERRVREVTERLVGAGHAAVVVTAEMDYAKTDRTEEQFGKEGALRSESRTEERAGAGVGAADATGGVAGARGNLPGAPAPTTTAPGAGGTSKLSETKNYEVDRVVSHVVGAPMRVKQLHVAVLVDQPGATARPAEEMARIAALAREAAGLSKERGDSIEVHSAPFAAAAGEPEAAPAPSPWPLPVPPLVAAGIGGGVLFLVVVAVRAAGDPADPTRTRVQIVDGNHVADVTATLDGGRLAGELAFRDGAAGQAGRDLDQLAYDIATKVNAVTQAAQTPDGSTGHALFVQPTTAAGAAAGFAVDLAVAADPRLVASAGAGEGQAGNGGLLALLSLRDQPLAGGGTRSFVDEGIRTLGAVGAATGTAVAARAQESARVQSLAAMRDSLSGVSQEEQLARLSAFQRASEAAGKLVASVNDLLANLIAQL